MTDAQQLESLAARIMVSLIAIPSVFVPDEMLVRRSVELALMLQREVAGRLDPRPKMEAALVPPPVPAEVADGD